MKNIHIIDSSIFVFAIAALIVIGCSSKPTVSDAHNIVEEQILEQAGLFINLLNLVRFEKPDAQESEIMGVKIYTIEYQAEIEFLSDCWWGGPFGGFEVVAEQPGPFNAYLFIGKKRAREGQREKVAGKLQFEKTEKGWRGPNGRIY